MLRRIPRFLVCADGKRDIQFMEAGSTGKRQGLGSGLKIMG